MFTRKELDQLNAEREKMQKPKTPAMRLSPNGTMRQSRDREDKAIRQARLESIEKRSKDTQAGLDKKKDVARDSFNGI